MYWPDRDDEVGRREAARRNKSYARRIRMSSSLGACTYVVEKKKKKGLGRTIRGTKYSKTRTGLWVLRAKRKLKDKSFLKVFLL